MSLNDLEVAGRRFLLVNGQSIHLAAEDDAGRAAFDGDALERARQRGYTGDTAELSRPRWVQTTLCGRRWSEMAPTEETAEFHSWNEDNAPVPTCGRCLQILDKLFPPPVAAPAVDVLAHLAAQQVVQWGQAEVHGVPGEQIEALRRAARQAVQRLGFRCRTVVHDSLVLIYSNEAYESIPEPTRQARVRAAVEAVDGALAGVEQPASDRPWRFNWSTWDI